MDRYIFKSARSTDGKIPKLTHLEKSTFEVQLLTEDGTPFDLTGYAAECAVNNTFDHSRNELMAYASGGNCVVTDAANGIIQITLDCNTVRFGQVVRFRSVTAMLELNLIDQNGETKRFLLINVTCLPRVRDQEGAPVSGDPQYYNKVEVDQKIHESVSGVASINGKDGDVELNAEDVGAIADPETAGTTGQILTKTVNGSAWKSPEQLVPVAAATFTPQSGIYYTQTAVSGDIDYVFTFTETPCTFEFWITKTASGAWTFSTSTGVFCQWEKDGEYAPDNPPPEITGTPKMYCFTFRWDGSDLLGNLAYTKTIEVSA